MNLYINAFHYMYYDNEHEPSKFQLQYGINLS